MNIPVALHYTKEHEWISIEGDTATVGITDFAQGELGDIVFVEIETLGQTLEKDAIFGTIEAVKTVSDLFLPIGGEIIEINQKILDNPELVNTDPYGEAWLVKIKVQKSEEIKGLLDADAYKELIGQ